jgi:S1-C subfamily serine protease
LEPINPEIHIESRGAVELGIKFSNYARIPKGVMIGEVTPGKSAAQAGLRSNDVILAFGDDEVNNSNDLVALLKKYEPGDVVKVVRARTSNLENTETVEVKLKGW